MVGFFFGSMTLLEGHGVSEATERISEVRGASLSADNSPYALMYDIRHMFQLSFVIGEELTI